MNETKALSDNLRMLRDIAAAPRAAASRTLCSCRAARFIREGALLKDGRVERQFFPVQRRARVREAQDGQQRSRRWRWCPWATWS
jgi:hypothetical protein